MSSVNTMKLRKAINNFRFYSKPSDGTGSNPCKIEDLNRVVENIARVLEAFVEELEED